VKASGPAPIHEAVLLPADEKAFVPRRATNVDVPELLKTAPAADLMLEALVPAAVNLTA
jgi:hypothetical protein